MKLLIKILSILIITSFLFPIVKVGATTYWKPDTIFTLLSVPFVVLLWNKIKVIPFARKYLFILFALFLVMFFSNYFGAIYILNSSPPAFPFTFLLILNRIVVFFLFFYVGYYMISNGTVVSLYISIIFFMGLLIGLLQYFDIGGVRDLSLKLYVPQGGVQEYTFMKFGRIFGVAPAIITWAGVCIMVFYWFYFVIENRYIRLLGCSFAVINILAAASRAGIAGLLGSFILVLLFKAVIVDKKFFSLFKILIYLIVLSVISFYLVQEYLPEQLDFIFRRFDVAEEALTTEGRGAQITFYLNILNEDPVNYFIGVGDIVIKKIGGYMEIDFFFILVSYGIIGVFLTYSLLYLLVKKSYELKEVNKNYFMFIFSSIIGYLIFSVGFYFMYELYFGLPFWWLNGLIFGLLLKQNRVYNESIGN
ncbi:MAG: hypothetical protein H6604_00460 [Flavobacteriales bacterium]|nr:hypothetical protein [Flavobacteriales bacterium]